ncbi:MAG: GNAT family N-acetyltransferase [Bacteroidota bacterium]|nr:GNAT family N-acetyltransferase [Bacteroidota bacterium]MDP4233507.1 GNAT family N-acetyltransferase [Bacteroidota bacterium]MDP4243384.1 GNAT family N-acetyltransferase [Bacteroidota bacterium]MDP4287929.1 GNAT family N-acetyltransferase [Bacteroidota bacterium]
MSAVRVVPYQAEQHEKLWDKFVARSMNGTVFHSQRFLDYHPPGRFNFHHLLFFEREKLVALLPGGLSNDASAFESPAGASYGSFVTEDISAQTALDVVAAFEDYVRERGFHNVYLTSAPVIYQPVLTQNLEFALLYRGYAYQRHYISHVVDLRRPGSLFDRFKPAARTYIRRAEREEQGVTVEHVARAQFLEGIEEFYPILIENKAKFDAKPTHTLEDLKRLHELLPNLMELFLVRKNGEAIAGLLYFIANKRVALVFYQMLRYEHQHIRPIYLVMREAAEWAKANGYAFVDIGVSQDTSDANPMTPALSLIHFKEKFDSRGVLRSTLHKQYG